MNIAAIATWTVLREFGFEPDDAIISDISPGLSFHFGYFKLSASCVMNLRFQNVVLFTGVLATPRRLAQVCFEMPREVHSRAQCAAWIVWHLDKATGGEFIPVRGADWLIEGRQNKSLLPWVARMAAYEARPQCLVQRDWLRMALKALREIIATASDESVVLFAFNKEVLTIRCADKLVAVAGEGPSWPKQYSIAAGSLRNLPMRLRGETVEVSVWEGRLHIGSWAYAGIVEV